MQPCQNALMDTPTPIVAKCQAGQLRIRRMRTEDATAVLPIEVQSFGMHHWSAEAFENEVGNPLGRYYLLEGMLAPEAAPMVLGYCGFWAVLDEAHVTTVAIDPTYRGQALGELLLQHMLQRAQSLSIKWMTLEVRLSNHAAQNLYTKYQFETQGVRPRYYQDNQEDAVIMTTPNINDESFRTLARGHLETLSQRLGGLPEGFDFG